MLSKFLRLFKKRESIDAVNTVANLARHAIEEFKPLIDSKILESCATIDYDKETIIFSYILTWKAIQSSNLKHADKHKMSSMLTRFFSMKINGEINDAVSGIKSLQAKLVEYRDSEPINNSSEMGYVDILLKNIGLKDPGLLIYATILSQAKVAETTNVLNDLNKECELVYQ